MADKPLCKIHKATSEAKWCALPAIYIVQPACACDWYWPVCGKCLSIAVKAATHREDQHDSKNIARVIAF